MGSRSRVRIAQASARLIAEHGLTDWSLAKRKACRELGLADNEPLPSNDEVEQALRDYNSLFRRDAQAASLRGQRLAALGWMDRLAAWDPVLLGGVAAGWATAYSEIRIELEAEDPKAVEMGLINAGVDYAPAAGNAQPELVAGRGESAVRLVVVTPAQRRNRVRRDEAARLSRDALRALLESESSSATG